MRPPKNQRQFFVNHLTLLAKLAEKIVHKQNDIPQSAIACFLGALEQDENAQEKARLLQALQAATPNETRQVQIFREAIFSGIKLSDDGYKALVSYFYNQYRLTNTLPDRLPPELLQLVSSATCFELGKFCGELRIRRFNDAMVAHATKTVLQASRTLDTLFSSYFDYRIENLNHYKSDLQQAIKAIPERLFQLSCDCHAEAFIETLTEQNPPNLRGLYTFTSFNNDEGFSEYITRGVLQTFVDNVLQKLLRLKVKGLVPQLTMEMVVQIAMLESLEIGFTEIPPETLLALHSLPFLRSLSIVSCESQRPIICVQYIAQLVRQGILAKLSLETSFSYEVDSRRFARYIPPSNYLSHFVGQNFGGLEYLEVSIFCERIPDHYKEMAAQQFLVALQNTATLRKAVLYNADKFEHPGYKMIEYERPAVAANQRGDGPAARSATLPSDMSI
jgi:hypothetical protein